MTAPGVALWLLGTVAAQGFLPITAANQAPGDRAVYLRKGESVDISVCARDAAGCGPLGDGQVRWYRAEPLALDYDNSHSAEPLTIQYRWTELPELTGKRFFPSQSVCAVEGSCRIAATVDLLVDPPTMQQVSRLFEIVVRRDDSYVGYLTELVGAPFVLFPRRIERDHVTDLRLGADCVALVIYGQRRLGNRHAYVGPSRLAQELEEVGGDVRAGDVLHFGFQTAVLSQDRPPFGAINDADLVLHTYHARAEEVPFGSLPYRKAPFRVLRWSGRRHWRP